MGIFHSYVSHYQRVNINKPSVFVDSIFVAWHLHQPPLSPDSMELNVPLSGLTKPRVEGGDLRGTAGGSQPPHFDLKEPSSSLPSGYLT